MKFLLDTRLSICLGTNRDKNWSCCVPTRKRNPIHLGAGAGLFQRVRLRARICLGSAGRSSSMACLLFHIANKHCLSMGSHIVGRGFVGWAAVEEILGIVLRDTLIIGTKRNKYLERFQTKRLIFPNQSTSSKYHNLVLSRLVQ